MKALNTLVGALIVVSASAYAAPSQAATSHRIEINHASAACMGAMQPDREMLRARTMGVANITPDATSEVKCGGVATPYNNYGDVDLFETAILNSSGAEVTVNCMLADGVNDGVFTVSTKFPRSVTIPAGEVGWIDWTPDDNGGANFTYPSLSCQLPTDVSISYTAITYSVDVGN